MYVVKVRSFDVECDTPEEAVQLARLIAAERREAKRREDERNDSYWVAPMHRPVRDQ